MKIKKVKSPFDMKMWYFGLPLSMVVFAFIFSIQTPAGLTYSGKMSLAVFMSALVLWVSNSLPNYVVALGSIAALTITGGWSEKEALGVFGYSVIWLMVAAFVITAGMEKSGLAKRMALFMISKFGKSTKMLVASLIAANFIIAFVVPSTTARAAIMFPIVILVAEAYGLHKEDGCANTGKLLSLTGMQANHLSTGAIVTATSAQILAMQMIQDYTGGTITWSDWFLGATPVVILTMVAMCFVGFILFKPSSNEVGDGIKKLQEEYEKLGKMTAVEYKAVAIFSVTVALWALDKFHSLFFGFEISLVMVAIIAAAAFFIPYIGILDWKETKIPWDLMVFSAGCYAAGTALNKNGVSEWALGSLFSKLGVENMSFTMLFGIVILIASFSHVVFTSKTVRTMVLIPTILALADAAGVPPISLALPAAFTISDTMTLPPQSKVNLIYMSSGYFSVMDQFKFGVITLVMKWGIMMLASFTLYKLLGIA